MKKIMLIALVILSTSQLKAQNQGVPDTLIYLQTIVANKSKFIGKLFSVLRDSLKLEIRYFDPKSNIVYDISKETSTRFGFYFDINADELYLTYPSLEIFWQTPLNATQSNVIWNNNNGGGWSTSAIQFYSPGIIRDIKVSE